MPMIEEVLNSLDPPVKHELQIEGDHASLLLLDPSIPAMVQLSLTIHEVNNKDQLRIVLLYAINELRWKGSHVPLDGYRIGTSRAEDELGALPEGHYKPAVQRARFNYRACCGYNASILNVFLLQ